LPIESVSNKVIYMNLVRHMLKNLLLASTLFCFSFTTHSSTIGEILTTDGEKYYISKFGATNNKKSYVLKVGKKYIPISKVKSISKVEVGGGRSAYLVVLNNGDIKSGRLGLFFYEKTKLVYPGKSNGKTVFVPVLKDRNQQGLIFTTSKNKRTIEIGYPNTINEIKLYTKNSDLKL